MVKIGKYQLLVVLTLCLSTYPMRLTAEASGQAKTALSKALLGMNVKALLDMPAYKDGIDLYVNPKSDKRLDERGIDMKEFAKYLREKGVGVERDEWVTITGVKVDSDRVEVDLGGGGEGRGASKNAAKKGAGFLRAGGTRINIRYGRDVTDSDLQIHAFLPLLARVLDVSQIVDNVDVQGFAPKFQEAIGAKTVIQGMSYQMVLTSFGDPDQKNIEDTTDGSLHETWYYLRDGHRWVVRFIDGKVAKVQVY